jgi:glycerate 2-kinase
VRRAPRCVEGEIERLVDELARAAEGLAPGEAFVAVGEPTLRVDGGGRGGRARHTALRLAERLEVLPERAALALASDGTDGSAEAAGAVVSSETAARARACSVDLAAAAAAFDSGGALEALSAALWTGPTGTNLTDLFVVARAWAE